MIMMQGTAGLKPCATPEGGATPEVGATPEAGATAEAAARPARPVAQPFNAAKIAVVFLLLLTSLSFQLHAQVGADRLVNAAREARNWLTYSGGYFSHRFSGLTQITPANAKNLELKWMYQAAAAGAWQTSPLVVDGVMYLTQRPNDVVALDAKTGRVFWIYRHTLDPTQIVCCGANNRGLAILGDTLFMGTLDAHLVAIDAKTGRAIWNTKVAESKGGYSVTHAPLVVKDKVIVGVGGGEYGIRGFVAAYDARSGRTSSSC